MQSPVALLALPLAQTLLLLLLLLLLLVAVVGHAQAKVTIYNASDCCCENIYPRSAKNLVRTTSECAANCAADSSCQAAILISAPPSDVVHQCQLSQPAPPGLGCCIHKRHFDGVTHDRPSSSTVIDMGTTSGPCPGHNPPPPPGPAPPPGPPPGSCSGECRRPWYHYTARDLITSDPNGLQWRRTASGKVSYEFFHQDRGRCVKNVTLLSFSFSIVMKSDGLPRQVRDEREES